MQFFKNLISSALGTLIALGLFFVFLFVFIAGSVAVLEEDGKAIEIESNTVLVMDMKVPIQDREPQSFSFSEALELDAEAHGLNTILPAITQAAEDERISGISIQNMSALGGIANISAVRDALLKFKESGKFIYAYGDYYGQSDYFLASVADSIFVHPEGAIDFRGLSAEVLYYKSAQEKSGVSMEVIRNGKYKSAVEPFLDDNMSDENREQIQSFLDHIWDEILADVSESRGMTAKELDQLADNVAGLTAQRAISAALADGTVTRRAYKEKISERLDEEDIEYVNFIDYMSVSKDKKGKGPNRIAVVYAQGEIMYGEGSSKIIGQEKIIKTLKKIGKKKNIKAVVLRVNSPGGSALASELIWEEIEHLKKTKKVVVSMGNVAASGGYYIAANADEIIAEPTTITGSIGVWGVLPNVNRLANRWGINAEQVTTNKRSISYSAFEPLSNATRQEIKVGINQVYQTFLSRVAEGRNMTKDEVHEIAQGRVWSGVEAKEIGLVDHLGGMETALERAAVLAEIEDYKITTYPKYDDDLESMLGELFRGPFGNIKQQLPPELGLWLNHTNALKEPANQIQTRLPFTLNIK
ncbi:MAG: signal peptide peptidase SppA [Bacteroidetes bacterium]|nr:signal peptide peptidase SppA [Bacteroidota bacterium]MDA1085059.1 signal peptide peptidase SppA [Bacteroidota bacterium]